MFYPQLFLTFLRNSLIRDMTFRANFLIELVTSTCWMLMNLGFYVLVFQYTQSIGGWDKHQFFVFIATTLLVNGIVQAFFMPNAEELSELVRTGGLDLALLKPVDTQFLLSLRRVEWASLGNFVVALALLWYALARIEAPRSWWAYGLYPVYVLCGALVLYAVMISLGATSIWLGRNQSLYDFWFYITNFSRYPMEIYDGPWGDPLRKIFTFGIPILLVINVPAQLLAKPLTKEGGWLAAFAVLATAVALAGSRWFFHRALAAYRSASS